jgi:hypothetical protein
MTLALASFTLAVVRNLPATEFSSSVPRVGAMRHLAVVRKRRRRRRSAFNQRLKMRNLRKSLEARVGIGLIFPPLHLKYA